MPRRTAVRAPGATLPAILLAAALAALAGCAATEPSGPASMRDPAANFAAFRTFGWSAPAAGQPLTLADQNVRAAIALELQRRGYSEAQEKPDLAFTFEATSAEKLQNNPVRIGIGIGSWGSSGGGSISVGSPSVQTVKQGTLVIHAIDTARNAEVWQGQYEGKLGGGKPGAAEINRAVKAAMKDFPARQ